MLTMYNNMSCAAIPRQAAAGYAASASGLPDESQKAIQLN